ncbi:caspase family protein [Nocardia beijingensis]
MTRLPDPLRSRAVLVGASSYADRDLADLPSVRANVTDLAEILTSDHGTDLPAAHCTVITEDRPIAELGARVERAAEDAEGLLLFYYAGHGLPDSSGGLYLTLPSTRTTTLRWTGLPFETIREAFAESRARNRVVILDCCYSGRAIGDRMSSSAPTLTGQLDVDGTFTLTSTPRNELAMAPPGAIHTAFTGELITLLTEGDPEGPELLTLGHIYQRLRWTMDQRGLPLPERCGTRTADLLALAPNRGNRGAPISATDRYAEQVRQRTAALGPDHLAVLAMRDRHAFAVGESGAAAEAARLYAGLAADFARLLAADHPETLRAREQHARWTAAAGDQARAAELHAALLADRTDVGRAVRSGPRAVGRSRASRKETP